MSIECPHTWVQILDYGLTHRLYCHDCGERGPAPLSWISSHQRPNTVVINVGESTQDVIRELQRLNEAMAEVGMV